LLAGNADCGYPLICIACCFDKKPSGYISSVTNNLSSAVGPQITLYKISSKESFPLSAL